MSYLQFHFFVLVWLYVVWWWHTMMYLWLIKERDRIRPEKNRYWTLHKNVSYTNISYFESLHKKHWKSFINLAKLQKNSRNRIHILSSIVRQAGFILISNTYLNNHGQTRIQILLPKPCLGASNYSPMLFSALSLPKKI